MENRTGNRTDGLDQLPAASHSTTNGIRDANIQQRQTSVRLSLDMSAMPPVAPGKIFQTHASSSEVIKSDALSFPRSRSLPP